MLEAGGKARVSEVTRDEVRQDTEARRGEVRYKEEKVREDEEDEVLGDDSRQGEN